MKHVFKLVCCFLLFAAGCTTGTTSPVDSNSISGESKQPVVKEDVELSFVHVGGNEQSFNTRFKEPIEKALPHIRLTFAGGKIEPEMVATGNLPDLIRFNNEPLIPSLLKVQSIHYDLTDMVMKHKLDLSRIEDSILSNIRSYSDGKLYSLPINARYYALFYNKSVFDRFGIPYPDPKKSMTWEETAELAKKLTRVDGGTAYVGMKLTPILMLDPLVASSVDPTTDKTLWQAEPKYKQYLDMLDQFKRIPGLFPEESTERGKWVNWQPNPFMQNNVAMINYWSGLESSLGIQTRDAGMSWDMAPHPVWKGQPNHDPVPTAQQIAISPTSKHKDAAFEVITYLLSDEYQMQISRSGFVTVLKNPGIKAVYQADNELVKGKNLQAFFTNKHSSYPSQMTRYHSLCCAIGDQFLLGVKSVRDVLREADEEHTRKIAEDKAKK